MQLIEATQDIRFQHAVFGEGSLARGKTYYTFGHFARETASRGMANIVVKPWSEVLHFKPSHLAMKGGPRKILLFFSGGLGDAVTAGIVLPHAAVKHGLSIDLCCAEDKWEHILRPMGLKGRRVPYPPDLEILDRYEAVLTDLTDFYSERDGLRTSPVIQLIKGFRLDDPVPEPRYEIPAEVRERCRLVHSVNPRIAVNFDSQGFVKSYPEHLRESLVDKLTTSGLEVLLLGSKAKGSVPSLPGNRTGNHGPLPSLLARMPVRDLRGATTIPELAALVEQVDLVLGVDSFIAHLSNLLSRPTMVLLSTTSPASFSWHRFVTCLPSTLECSPCFSLFDRCPKGYPVCRALDAAQINPDAIAEAVLERLAGAAKDGA
jgi:ADP-heptose:LPS heptosyltransferase